MSIPSHKSTDPRSQSPIAISPETYTTQGFWDFISERQLILMRKLNGESKLTDDEILSTEKFCNIDREDDKGTRDLRTAVWENPIVPLKTRFMYSMIYRFCVSSSTILDTLGDIPPHFWSKNTTVEIFTCPSFKFKWRKSVPYHLPLISRSLRTNQNGVCSDNLKWIITKIHAHHNEIWDELTRDTNQSHDELTTRLTAFTKPLLSKGFKFYIAQALLDLMYYSEYIDPNKQVHLGIGALKGIKRITTTPPHEYITYLLTSVPPRVLELFPRGINPAVLEHGLCEYTKYCEYKEGTRTRKFFYSNIK